MSDGSTSSDEDLRRSSKRDYRHEVARAASYKQLHWLVAIAAPPAFTDYFCRARVRGRGGCVHTFSRRGGCRMRWRR